ncbi:uncharacterized protein LOC102607849 isoform X1 [Citrus sinensis]|uniref:uncharacterized protein LOC102607849 isoform X1 n=1 Tax=Citrus sinensis TaxID=2711 RepID=UPI0003D6EA58|nr:uncharacterized protein LOC102607849 isoform X1 [Citrus sinensis]
MENIRNSINNVLQLGFCNESEQMNLMNAIISCWSGRSQMALRTLYLLLLGQLVSFSLALSSFTTAVITDLGVDAPITQSVLCYLSLALAYGGILLYRRQRLQVSWYWYLLLGFVDVQGNFLFNKAFQFTSISSVTLLDCCAIPCAIVFTWVFLGTRYSIWQLFGASLCVLGLGLMLLSDAEMAGGGGSRPLLGDILVIAGAIFFAMSYVGEEFLVKKIDRVEVVCMIGVYGLLVSVVQLYPFLLGDMITFTYNKLYTSLCGMIKFPFAFIPLPSFRSTLELKSLESVKWSTDIILSFVGNAASSFMFYTLVPFVLKLSGATMLILSVLTSDMWAVILRIFCYHQQVNWTYYLAFAAVLIGLIIYSTTAKDLLPIPALENGNYDVQYQRLDDENMASRGKESFY